MKKTAIFLLATLIIVLSFSSCIKTANFYEKDEENTSAHTTTRENETIISPDTLAKTNEEKIFLSELNSVFAQKENKKITNLISSKNNANIEQILISKYYHSKEESRPFVSILKMNRYENNPQSMLISEFYYEKISFNKIFDHDDPCKNIFVILKGYSYDSALEYLDGLKELNPDIGYSIGKKTGWGDYGYLSITLFT